MLSIRLYCQLPVAPRQTSRPLQCHANPLRNLLEWHPSSHEDRTIPVNQVAIQVTSNIPAWFALQNKECNCQKTVFQHSMVLPPTSHSRLAAEIRHRQALWVTGPWVWALQLPAGHSRYTGVGPHQGQNQNQLKMGPAWKSIGPRLTVYHQKAK